MWTQENRGRMANIARKTKRYPTDLTDEEWERMNRCCPNRRSVGAKSASTVVGSVGDDPINGEVRRQDPIHSFAIGHVSARDLDCVDIHVRINRQVHLAPRRAGRLLTVLLFVPLAGSVEARPRTIDDDRYVFAIRQPSGQPFAALFDRNIQLRKQIAQVTVTGYRDVKA